jgi:hypothetical protein
MSSYPPVFDYFCLSILLSMRQYFISFSIDLWGIVFLGGVRPKGKGKVYHKSDPYKGVQKKAK